jgi:thiol-disulfide isomerase/thioredoxin
MNINYFKLIYYFNNSCKACKDYINIVNKLSDELNIDLTIIDIDNGNIRHTLNGIPTVILEDDKSHVIYRSTGNLPFPNLKKEVMEVLKNG